MRHYDSAKLLRKSYKLVILTILVVLVLSIFKYKAGKTNNKFITSLSFLSGDIISTSSKRKRRIIVYDSVTRYGPRSVASASGYKKPPRRPWNPVARLHFWNVFCKSSSVITRARKERFVHYTSWLRNARQVFEGNYKTDIVHKRYFF